MLEAIDICEKITEKKMKINYLDQNRIGDHIWWISDVSKFNLDYPEWKYTYDINSILKSIAEALINKK
jgi:CDP-paratose 2-epimerase